MDAKRGADASWTDAMAWMRTGALGADPAVKAAIDAGQDAFDDTAMAVHAALRSEAGQVLMEVLLDLTVRRAPVDHSLPSDSEYLRYAQLRMGQNQVLAGVLLYYDRAEQLEAQRHAPAPVPDDPSDVLAGGGRGERGPAAGGPGDDPTAWLDFASDASDAAVTG